MAVLVIKHIFYIYLLVRLFSLLTSNVVNIYNTCGAFSRSRTVAYQRVSDFFLYNFLI